jgi:hypothetical protein
MGPRTHLHCKSLPIRLATGLSAVLFLILFGVSHASAAKVLYVVGSTDLNKGELQVKQRLESKGHTVVVCKAADLTSAGVTGKNLVLVSDSVVSIRLGPKLRNVEVPVVCCEAYQYDDLGMTGVYGKTEEQQEVKIVLAQHELSRGVKQGLVGVGSSDIIMGWGVPGPLGIKVAQLVNSTTKYTIFAYEAGVQMHGLYAPARRVGFFMTTSAPGFMTDAGWTLFDDAVIWALGKETVQCGSGFTRRMKVVNNSSDTMWMIETPPGGSKPTVAAQWDWWKNNYGEKLRLAKGSTINFCVPDKGAPGGNFRFYTGCDANGNNCIVGSPAGDLSGVNTLFEPTFGCSPSLDTTKCAFNPSADAVKHPHCKDNPNMANCGAIGPGDNFDISAVDGYTVPMLLQAVGTNCNRATTDASMLDLGSCPSETKDTLYSTLAAQEAVILKGVSLLTKNTRGLRACASPCKWFSSTTLGSPKNPVRTPPDGCNSASYYCCGGKCASGDHRCPGCSGADCLVGPKGNSSYPVDKTNFVRQMYAMGYYGYTWAYGDSIGDQGCDWGTKITLTLSPNGGTPSKQNKWKYDGKACIVSASGTYASLFDCQTHNMKYKFVTKDAMCTVSPTGTLTYEQCKAKMDW